MENIKARYDILLKALKVLEVILNFYAKKLNSLDLNDEEALIMILALRDSVIQRFEYCYELTWKYLALFLQEKHGVLLEVYSPRSTFRAACQTNVLSEQEAAIALQMVEDRNKTSHIYREEFADYVAKVAPGYYQFMRTCAEKCVA